MNAGSYKVKMSFSPLDFLSIVGLGQSSLFFQTETPHIINNKVVLTITKKYILTEMSNNKEHEILSAQSVYEIPTNEINTREDIYEFYKEATLNLNEGYQFLRTQMPTLTNTVFPTPPIENYKNEIDNIFNLLNSQN